MFGKILTRTFAFTVALMIFSVAVLAQDLDDVTISGKVTDSAGLPVVGATVTATMTETGESRTVVTNDDGVYRLIKLKPGTYKVKVSSGGFGAQETPEIPTISAQNVQRDFKLAPADVTAETTVTVTEDDGPLVDTTRIIVGGTLTQREIEEIPNNTRNVLDLVLTLGGTAEEALSSRDLAEDTNANNRLPPTEQGNFTISGGAAFSNNLTVDGLDNNDDYGAGSRFTPSIEAVAEVQVIRNQFSAEYGRASGGRINVRTRGGSNSYKGRLFMFYKTDKTNANTWYNNNRGFSRRKFDDYTPGFTFGGPVVLPWIYDGKNRTHFFVSYDFNYLDDTSLIDTWIPTSQNPNWTLAAPTGPERRCDLTRTVPPCAAGTELGEYNKTLATPNRTSTVSIRLDHRLFKGNDLTLNYQFGRKKLMKSSSIAPLTRTDDVIQARKQNTDGFNLTDNHVFGSKVVNQFRFQWSTYRPTFETDAEDAAAPVIIILLTNPLTGSTYSLVTGNSNSSNTNGAIYSDRRIENRYQYQDTLTYVLGNHTLKGGVDVHRINSRTQVLENGTGTWSFNPHGGFTSGASNWANNEISQYRQNFGGNITVKNTYWGAFINDEFRLRNNLTVSAGVRYERESTVNDTNNWGPRLGFAWSPSKNSNSVIRAGGGIFYNRVLLRTIFNDMQSRSDTLFNFNSTGLPGSSATPASDEGRVLAAIQQNFPNAFTLQALQSLIAGICPITCVGTSSGFTRNTSGNPFREVEKGLKIPESYQVNVGYERQIGKAWVFEVNYTWNKTVNLWREYDRNAAALPAGFAEYSDWLLGPGNDWLVANANSTTRTYRFYVDRANPAVTVTGCSTTANSICMVNLATSSTSRTAPTTTAIGMPMEIANQSLNRLRPDPLNEEKETVASIGNSAYHGLVLEMRSRYRQIGAGFGSSLRFVYTLSRMWDDGLNNTTNATMGADFAREWARARQDRLHKIAISGTLEVPWWLGKLRFSPLFRYGSSAPFDLGMGIDRNVNYNSNDRPDFSGSLSEIVWRAPGTPFPADLYNKFSLPLIGSRGNVPRNAGKGPSMYIFDIGVGREIRLSERMRLRPNVEVSNVFNMRVFNYGSEFINFFGTATPSQVQMDGFLVPSRTYRHREMRFGIRFDF